MRFSIFIYFCHSNDRKIAGDIYCIREYVPASDDQSVTLLSQPPVVSIALFNYLLVVYFLSVKYLPKRGNVNKLILFLFYILESHAGDRVHR